MHISPFCQHKPEREVVFPDFAAEKIEAQRS